MRTLFILLIAVVSGQAEAWRVPWNQTPEVFAGKFVTVHLASGTLIGGTWIHVTPSAFTIKRCLILQTRQRLRKACGSCPGHPSSKWVSESARCVDELLVLWLDSLEQ